MSNDIRYADMQILLQCCYTALLLPTNDIFKDALHPILHAHHRHGWEIISCRQKQNGFFLLLMKRAWALVVVSFSLHNFWQALLMQGSILKLAMPSVAPAAWKQQTLHPRKHSQTHVLLLLSGRSFFNTSPSALHKGDFIANTWDSFGCLLQCSAAKVPWQVIEGNHKQEVVKDELGFLAYETRFHTSSVSSESHISLYCSYEVAGLHVIMLGCCNSWQGCMCSLGCGPCRLVGCFLLARVWDVCTGWV